MLGFKLTGNLQPVAFLIGTAIVPPPPGTGELMKRISVFHCLVLIYGLFVVGIVNGIRYGRNYEPVFWLVMLLVSIPLGPSYLVTGKHGMVQIFPMIVISVVSAISVSVVKLTYFPYRSRRNSAQTL